MSTKYTEYSIVLVQNSTVQYSTTYEKQRRLA